MWVRKNKQDSSEKVTQCPYMTVILHYYLVKMLKKNLIGKHEQRLVYSDVQETVVDSNTETQPTASMKEKNLIVVVLTFNNGKKNETEKEFSLQVKSSKIKMPTIKLSSWEIISNERKSLFSQVMMGVRALSNQTSS